MVSTTTFDLIYYLFTIVTILTLGTAIFLGVLRNRSTKEKSLRNLRIAVVLVSSGAIIDFAWAVLLTALSRSGGWWDSLSGGLFYQQATYSVIYAGTALVLFGITRSLQTFWESAGIKTKTRASIALWITYLLAVVVSLVYLFNPGTYTITYSGIIAHVAEQRIFWLPAFLALAIGTAIFSIGATKIANSSMRRGSILTALFCVLLFLGSLRESNIIPSTGDPLSDLLLAFAPFAASAFCLMLSQISFSVTPLTEFEKPPSHKHAE